MKFGTLSEIIKFFVDNRYQFSFCKNLKADSIPPNSVTYRDKCCLKSSQTYHHHQVPSISSRSAIMQGFQ